MSHGGRGVELGVRPHSVTPGAASLPVPLFGLPERFKTKPEKLKVAVLTLKRMYLVII